MTVGKVVWRMLYLGFLLIPAVWLWVYLTAFDGFLRLEPGRGEHVAFVPAGDVSPWRGRIGLPAELLRFDIPSTVHHLPDDRSYGTRELPYRVSLEDMAPLADMPPRDTLRVQQGDTAETLDIRPGDTLPQHSLQVETIRAWHGLAPHPRGLRSARIDIVTAEAERSITLEADRWVIAPAGAGTGAVALTLRWHPSPEAARKAAGRAARPTLRDAWWTLKEGEGELRFNSLAPGAGTESEDGSVWTVERLTRDEAAPQLELRVEEKGGVRRVTASANVKDPDARAAFHVPSAAEHVVEIHAWQDMQGVAVLLPREGEARTADLRPGAPLPLAEGLRLYVVQLLAYGLPARPEGNPIHEAVLEGENGARWFLRDSQPEHRDGLTLLFRREQPEPPRKLLLTAVQLDGRGEHRFSLSPGSTFRLGAWSFQQESVTARETLLRVRYAPQRTSQAAGLVLFILGAVGWGLSGLLRRSPASAEEAAQENR
jgi:hypothetical protein